MGNQPGLSGQSVVCATGNPWVQPHPAEWEQPVGYPGMPGQPRALRVEEEAA